MCLDTIMISGTAGRNRKTVYLDNAASTPVDDAVIAEMIPYLKEQYGNPSSIHRFGRDTGRALQLARRRVADLIGARPREIIFTSGGTEADNLAVKGAALQARKQDPERRCIITSSIEHDAILEPCKALESSGFDIVYLPVTADGFVRPSDLKDTISKKAGRVALVSIMYANNEVGSIQPVAELVSIAHAAGALFHTDAVQAAGKIPIDVNNAQADLMSISSHKINGPKGTGALYIRHGVMLYPLIHGGGQEFLVRSGTENVHGIVGFGKACELAREKIGLYSAVRELRDYIVSKVIGEIAHCRLNGPDDPAKRLPTNAHFTFYGVNGEDMIIKLDEYGFAVSTGSACSVKKQKPSHVLKAMGFSYEEITGSLRITLGLQNTREEIDSLVQALSEIVGELRSLSPFKEKYD
jgi:cysteine desulfurase